ncbi:hypothetical protein Bca101_054614 [Brassica carinata]
MCSEATKRCSMAVKTDMSKAYDRIEWSFVKEVLGLLGFDPIWIGWIMCCIESVSYSFLVNGSPQGLVKPTRGLRQGDPLSPHIFILCTEVLSALCAKGQADGSLPGVRVSHNSPPINHLLFADDTMFFCKSKPTCILALKKILATYETVSGQRINPQKSAITFSAKTPDITRARVKGTMEIYTEGGVGKYLGLPEQFGRRKRDIFASILDRIRQKAHSWKARFLSGAGKQVMLKSVLSAMPCHAMSCFKLPISLCNQIQSMLTRFWWDANPEKRKMCWVAWDTMTLPKYAGGLGGIFASTAGISLSNFSEAHSHVTSAIMAEAIAVHRAVSLAVYSNVRSLAVLSDSLSLIKLLKKGEYLPELFGIMFDIYHFMFLFDVISFDYVSRNFNSEADCAAKSALALSVSNPLFGG